MTFVNRPAQWMFPSQDFPKLIKNTLLKVAPKGLNQVVSMSCGSCSNENAFKAVFMWHMRKERGGIELPSSDDVAYSSVMQNKVCCSLVKYTLATTACQFFFLIVNLVLKSQ